MEAVSNQVSAFSILLHFLTLYPDRSERPAQPSHRPARLNIVRKGMPDGWSDGIKANFLFTIRQARVIVLPVSICSL